MTELTGNSPAMAPPRPWGRLAAALAHPRRVAIGAIILLTGLGWLYLGIMAATSLGAGGNLVGVLVALCEPFGGSFGMPRLGSWNPVDLALLFAMWGAMSLAMMLPSAAPMLLTYAEIADTAARRNVPVVSPIVLAGGYLAVWLSFALLATLAQSVLARYAVIDAAIGPAGRILSAALFVVAGAYQFSPLKQSCLRACQRPFPFFFANWKTTTAGVFGLGLRTGLHCLGCCWAMMLLMFAVGIMNVIWMAALAVVMTIEKMTATPRFSHAIGVLLIATGIVFYAAQGLVLLRWL